MSCIELPAQLPTAIDSHLRRFVRRYRWVALGRAVGRAVLGAILWLLVWGIVDRLIALPDYIRSALLILLVASMIVIVNRPLAAILGRSIDFNAAAQRWDNRDTYFRQALATVVSQSLASPDQRASEQLLAELARDVESRLAHIDPAALVPVTPVIRVMGAVGTSAILLIALSFWTWLGLPRLLHREISPTSDTSPVTDIRLFVIPGDFDVSAGKEAKITARAMPAPRGNVMLRTSTDGETWTQSAMVLASNGDYTHTLPVISRDVKYQVMAGDAVGGPYTIRVLRAPVIRQFRIHLTYPKYVSRPAITITSAEGLIEAPIDTEATVSVVASEPLLQASYILNGERTAARITGDPHVFEFKLPIKSDGRCEIELTSQRHVREAGAVQIIIHAVPDHAPVAAIRLPVEVLLFGPHDKVPVPFSAGDDFGLESLNLRIDNGGAAVGNPSLLPEKPSERIEETKTVELSDWNVSLGDVVGLTLIAQDRNQHSTSSQTVQIAIVPQAISPDQRSRVTRWHDASQTARSIHDELENALRILQQPDQTDRVATMRRATTAVASASESATLLSRNILRVAAGARSDDVLRAAATLIDRAQILASRLNQDTGFSADNSPDRLRQRLEVPRDLARQMAQDLTTIWQGSAAEIVQMQRRNLASIPQRAEPQFNPLREEIDTQEEQLGLDPRQVDLDGPTGQLQARIDAAFGAIREFDVINVDAIARDWAQSDGSDPQYLAERLLAAGQLEAVCANHDTDWAKDLYAAARASRMIDAMTGPERSATRNRFVMALRMLMEEHQGRRSRGATSGPQNQSNRVETARRAMLALAGESPKAAPTTQAIDRFGATAEGESREQALASVRRIQEMLAALPQILASVERSSQQLRLAQKRSADVTAIAATAPPAERGVANRTVLAADDLLDEAVTAISDVAETIVPEEFTRQSRDLRAIVPEIASLETIDRELVPALLELRQAVDDRNPDAVERATRESRQATVVTQDAFRDARQILIDRDPVAAARWFAQFASATTQPLAPNRPPAPDSLDRLHQSWDDSLQRTLDRRLAGNATQRDQPLEPDSSPHAIPSYPPAYKDALEAYFQSLEAAKVETKR